MRLLFQLLEDTNHKEIVHLLLFFMNSKFLRLKKQLPTYLIVLYFLQFVISNLRGNKYFAKLNQ